MKNILKKSVYNLLLYLFVWSRPNAVIRSTFYTKDRKGWEEGGICDEDDDSDDDKGLASEDTSEDREKDFEGRMMECWVEAVEGGSRALDLGK